MSHKISPDVLHAARDANTRRPGGHASLLTRIGARIRAQKYDRLLAVGVVPQPHSALAVHRARVTSTAEREAIARALRQALRDTTAERTALSNRVPLNIADITAARDLIDRVTLRLHSPRPISSLGMARLRLILSDGAGPMYRCGRGDLSGRLGAALAEL